MEQSVKPTFISDYTDSFSVLRNDAFRVDHPFRATRQLFGPSVLDTEGDNHVMRKRGWLSAFSRSAVAAEPVRQLIEDSVTEGLRVARERNDLMATATFIPNKVVLGILGCDDVDPFDHAEKIRPAVDYLETNAKTPAALEAKAYLFNGPFKAAEGLLVSIPEKERNAELMLFAIAGSETTSVAIKLMLLRWATDHAGFMDAYNSLAVEEFVLKLLREDPPLGVATRYCVGPAAVGQWTYEKGDIVHVDLVAANGGCPAAAKNVNNDLTFGSGKHSCPGHLLARAELERFAPELAKLDPAQFSVEYNEISPRPMNFRHPSGLVIRYVT